MTTGVEIGLILLFLAPFGAALRVASLRWSGTGPDAASVMSDVGEPFVRAGFKAETLSLERELRWAAASSAALAREVFAQIQIAADADLVVRMDRGVLRSALLALVVEALRAAPDGHVLVVATRVGQQAHLRVMDDDADCDQATREARLREAAALIALEGGSTSVEARTGQGTTVTIRLPIRAVSKDVFPELVEEPELVAQTV